MKGFALKLLAESRLVVILSEVAKATKFEEKSWKIILPFFCLWFALAECTAVAAPSFSRSGPPPASGMDQLNECNWIVTYRGRTYDLAPLTREALARPIESDIRYALERVPEASDHLRRMAARSADAKAHSVIASIFLGGLVAFRLARSGEANTDKRSDFNQITTITGALFIAAGFFQSWRATSDAKDELVKAVDAFNEKSPYKIQPADGGKLLPDASLSFPGEKDAEKNRP